MSKTKALRPWNSSSPRDNPVGHTHSLPGQLRLCGSLSSWAFSPSQYILSAFLLYTVIPDNYLNLKLCFHIWICMSLYEFFLEVVWAGQEDAKIKGNVIAYLPFETTETIRTILVGKFWGVSWFSAQRKQTTGSTSLEGENQVDARIPERLFQKEGPSFPETGG